MHEYDKQQLKRTWEQESDSLRKQLEQQTRLALLADEIKFNSDKLNSIQNRLESATKVETVDKSGLLDSREQLLKDMENKLRSDRE